MGVETMDDQSAPDDAQAAEAAQKRERSTIEFPYADLENAIEIARVLRDRVGTISCEVRQLAGWLDQTPTSGTFRSRLSAARIFGLIETERGQGHVSLTPLGRDILDDTKGPGARSTAFLSVPLYREMYETHNGHSLPPAAAIERQMVQLGVAKKQADRARQVFAKSAAQANYIDPQSGRFIKPAISGAVKPREGAEEKKKGGSGGDGPPLHPFIQGLLNELPKSGSEWPSESRALWLSTAESIFKMIYKEPSPNGKRQQDRESDKDDLIG